MRWFWRYPLWKAGAFMHDMGWRTYWYGFTVGDWGFGVMVRRRSEENQDAD